MCLCVYLCVRGVCYVSRSKVCAMLVTGLCVCVCKVCAMSVTVKCVLLCMYVCAMSVASPYMCVCYVSRKYLEAPITLLRQCHTRISNT